MRRTSQGTFKELDCLSQNKALQKLKTMNIIKSFKKNIYMKKDKKMVYFVEEKTPAHTNLQAPVPS